MSRVVPSDRRPTTTTGCCAPEPSRRPVRRDAPRVAPAGRRTRRTALPCRTHLEDRRELVRLLGHQLSAAVGDSKRRLSKQQGFLGGIQGDPATLVKVDDHVVVEARVRAVEGQPEAVLSGGRAWHAEELQPFVVRMESRSRSNPTPTVEVDSPTSTVASPEPSSQVAAMRALPGARATSLPDAGSTATTSGSLLDTAQPEPPETTMRWDSPGLCRRMPSGSIRTDAFPPTAHRKPANPRVGSADRTLQA